MGFMGAGMTDEAGKGAPEEGKDKVELRISLSGTHTRRDDLEALRTWLKTAPVLEDALERGELTLQRKDSLTQTEAMSGELVQDIILLVTAEAVRPVFENAWRSVGTWLRNRRRFAAPEEAPRVTLDGPPQGPGSGLSRDTDTFPGSVGTDTGRTSGPDDGPPASDGRDRTRGDEAGEV